MKRRHLRPFKTIYNRSQGWELSTSFSLIWGSRFLTPDLHVPGVPGKTWPQHNLRHKAESAVNSLPISAFSLVVLPCSVAVVAVVTITTAFSTSFAPSFSTAVTAVASVPVVPSIPAFISPMFTSTSEAHAISQLIRQKVLVQLGQAVPGRHDGHWFIDSFIDPSALKKNI